MTRARLPAAALGAAVVLALPAVALAATPAEVLRALNAERAANGIPADVREAPEQSAGCALHNDYRAANGGAAVGHDEDPSRPGYTPEGDQAGNSAVLAGTSWSAGDPYADAPIHLMRLMDPRLQRAGVDDRPGLSCTTVTSGLGPPGPDDAVFTVPGDGRSAVPVAQVAEEAPFVPGDLLRLPAGTRTGPHLLVLADGPFARDGETRVADVRLTGPLGPVEVRWVDDADPRIGPYIPPGGIAVPVEPLIPGSAYRATATVAGVGGVRLTRAWSFRTAGTAPWVTPPPSPPPAALTGRADVTVRVRGRHVVLASPPALAGRTARVRVTLGAATRRLSVRLAGRSRLMLSRAEARADRTRIAVRVPGFAAGGVRWQTATVRTSVGRARA
ncbi:MAG TPA: hypothetical protein VL422_08775 [Miltoncostaea sp.]|nr:hypothetical protein [Miltoncostaea sp.]